LKTGASHVEGDGEVFSSSSEVFTKLALGFDEDQVLWPFREFAEAHATRRVVFPENRDQAFVT
jgi:hypothetical protein